MEDRRILCRVVDEGVPVVAANAFRILEEVGDTFFLDFIYQCPSQTNVVARMRMHRGTLTAVRDRLVNDVVEFQSRMVH